jgi:hypothetical protein
VTEDRHVNDNEEAVFTITALLYKNDGELATKNLTITPSPDLMAEEVVTAIIRGLQLNDIPKENSRLLQCYKFMDL